MDPALLKAMSDTGGWVFATAAITAGALLIIRYLFGLLGKALDQNQQLAVGLAQMTSAVDALSDQVSRLDPSSRRR